MKISEVTEDILKQYLRIDYDEPLLNMFMISSKSYIKKYLNLDDDVLDAKEDLTIVYLALINDMYDKREFTSSGNIIPRTNAIIESILGLYSNNLV
ncbi:hypothetical protein BJV38_003279 [Clostridium beijerinckii]|uniref:head-tail connector protein n=1 Tax=Clostridium beijerinckii TaxID=1520 RepID=UPI00156DAAC2|nr:head-tail connector protein [Clostridium beijerinckii]NRT34135.1 hypothetical protein [Clostridium beijerinckii]NRT46436.1 hypothetical protein [Clostridium beijerinckii]NRZ19560.1 hypothetical protein [Clostridium beijerinckii]